MPEDLSQKWLAFRAVHNSLKPQFQLKKCIPIAWCYHHHAHSGDVVPLLVWSMFFFFFFCQTLWSKSSSLAITYFPKKYYFLQILTGPGFFFLCRKRLLSCNPAPQSSHMESTGEVVTSSIEPVLGRNSCSSFSVAVGLRQPPSPVFIVERPPGFADVNVFHGISNVYFCTLLLTDSFYQWNPFAPV